MDLESFFGGDAARCACNDSSSDNNQRSGMNPAFWGPALWDFLFAAVLGAYPKVLNPQDPTHIVTAQGFASLITTLTIVMPCRQCRESYQHLLHTSCPLREADLVSRMALAHWVFRLKNAVIRKLVRKGQRAPAPPVAFEDVVRWYQHQGRSSSAACASGSCPMRRP